MLDPNKRQLIITVDTKGVEACLDSTSDGQFALRIESLDTRVVVLVESEKLFLDMFDQFVKEYMDLKEFSL